MIGAPLYPASSAALFAAASVRPLNAPTTAPRAGEPAWMDGLGGSSSVTLRADVAVDQRGLSVQQHAERVLSALIG